LIFFFFLFALQFVTPVLTCQHFPSRLLKCPFWHFYSSFVSVAPRRRLMSRVYPRLNT
jgi:hypothetical protein